MEVKSHVTWEGAVEKVEGCLYGKAFELEERRGWWEKLGDVRERGVSSGVEEADRKGSRERGGSDGVSSL